MRTGAKRGGSRRRSGRFSRRAGFSLVEMIVVIAFLAIVAAVAIPVMNNVLKASSYETAKRNMRLLNGAVIAYNEGVAELTNASGDGQAVFTLLCTREATNPSPGSPYLPPNAVFVSSSDTATYRATWNGRMFKLVPAGTGGSGLDLLKLMGSSSSTN